MKFYVLMDLDLYTDHGKLYYDCEVVYGNTDVNKVIENLKCMVEGWNQDTRCDIEEGSYEGYDVDMVDDVMNAGDVFSEFVKYYSSKHKDDEGNEDWHDMYVKISCVDMEVNDGLDY